MLKLIVNRGPEWVDLGHGVEVLVAPVTTGVIIQAREDAALDPDAGIDRRVSALTAAVARAAILDWRGVAAADGVTPAEVSPDAIAALMDIFPLSQAFYARVVAPALVVVSEKNVSSPAPSGISAGATTIAEPAPGDATPAPSGSMSPKH
jgi:hypothetical protein